MAASNGHAPIYYFSSTNYYQDINNDRFPTAMLAFLDGWNRPYGPGVCVLPNGVPTGSHAILLGAAVDTRPWTEGYYVGSLWGPYSEYRDCNTGAIVRPAQFGFDDDEEHWSSCTLGTIQTRYPGAPCGIRPGIDPDKSRGKPNCACADPIDVSTGNKYEEKTEYEGGGVFPLRFTWTYNSSGVSPAASTTDRILGANRTLNYLRTVNVSIMPEGGLVSAYLARGDGKTYIADLTNGAWVFDADVDGTLTSSQDTSGNFTGFAFRNEKGQLESYDASGNLISITDRSGLKQTISRNTNGKIASVQDASGRALSFIYDTSGRLLNLMQPDGGIIAFAYDSSNNLQSVTYPDGKSVQYNYGETAYTSGASLPHALTSAKDELGTVLSTTSYNSAGLAIANSLAGGVEPYSFNYTLIQSGAAAGNISSTAVTYPLGKQVTFNFQAVLGINHPSLTSEACNGCATTTSTTDYGSNGRASTAVDGKGTASAYGYDAAGLLSSYVEAQGQTAQRTTTTIWDDSLRAPLQTVITDSQGNVVDKKQWTYNTLGQPLAYCEIDATISASASYTCSNTSAPPAGVRRWIYSYCNTIDSTQCPQVGLLLSVSGPRADVAQVTTYSYYMTTSAVNCGTPGADCYSKGDLRTVTDALGHVTTYASYDANGRVTRITDANGVNTDFTYTPRGLLASLVVGNAATHVTYTAYGAVQAITDADGVSVTYTYDSAHRLTDVTDALGDRIHYTLDAAGNKIKEETFDTSGTLRRSLARTYNTLGQLIGIRDGLNSAVFDASFGDSYDGNGNLVHSADGLSTQRKQGYDGLNRLISTLDNYNGTNPTTKNSQSVFAYDARDQLQGVGDPDSINTTYDHDGLGNLKAVHSPDTGTTNFQHDAAGNVIQRTDARGVTAQYRYDALNRLTGITYPAHPGLNITYSYDEPTPIPGCPDNFNTGHLTSMADASGTTAWCYTNQGDIREVRQVINGVSYLHGYAYTPARRLKYLQYPSGFELLYTYDANGRIQTVSYRQELGPFGNYTNSTFTPLITNVSYLPFGPVTGYNWAQGSQAVVRTYDANYRLIDLVSSALNLHFLRDAMGNITAEGDTPGVSTPKEMYRYDELYRLTELDDQTGAMKQGFTYSQGGDRLSETMAGQPTIANSYQSGTHRLSAVGGQPRQFDANGNTTALTAPTGALVGLGYDDRNLLTVVQSAGTTIGSYQYNGQGVRVWRAITSPATGQAATVYDPANTGNLYGEYFADDYREYIYLDGMLVASATNAGRSAPLINYLHTDHLGTLRAVTDTQGAVNYSWPWVGNAFGDQPKTGSGSFYLRFPGQYLDVETGLHYNINRVYEPTTGRYLQSDPMGLLGGQWSTYAYVSNDPLGHIDPLGLQSTSPLCAMCHSAPPALPMPPVTGAPSTPGQLSAPNSGTDGGAGTVPDTEAPAKPKVCPPPPRDPCEGIARQLEIHRKKLEDYMADPMAHDNLGRLSSAEEDRRAAVYQGRIINLLGQIASFERQLAKCRAEKGGG